MIKVVKITELRPIDGHTLWLRFSDGAEGVMDFSGLLGETGPMVEPLRDPAFFKRAFISFGVPTWPNGFDVDAIALHMDMEAAGLLSAPVAAE